MGAGLDFCSQNGESFMYHDVNHIRYIHIYIYMYMYIKIQKKPCIYTYIDT